MKINDTFFHIERMICEFAEEIDRIYSPNYSLSKFCFFVINKFETFFLFRIKL